MESEELRQVATEATRSAKARWKDIESGKVETKIEKTKIDLGNSVSRVYNPDWLFVLSPSSLDG